MGNFTGVLFNPSLPASFGCVSGADVTLTAGSAVTFITTGALVANYPGDYYPLIQGCLALACGGSAPVSCAIAFKLGSGSAVATFTVAPAVLVNSTTVLIPFAFVGATSASAWIGSGSTINITANCGTNNGTAKNVGSYAIVQLIQGPNI